MKKKTDENLVVSFMRHNEALVARNMEFMSQIVDDARRDNRRLRRRVQQAKKRLAHLHVKSETHEARED